jgi:hypothetical protein
VAPSLRPFWFAAVFLAGGGVGAAGVHLLIESTPDELGAKAAGQARQPQGGDLPAEEPTGADTGRTQVDREALRAALAELLAEERRSVPAEIAEEEEPDPAEGMSAAEALARLEAAYRAELAARERLARAHEEESPEEGVVAEQAADERAVAERTFAEASVEDPRERELLEAPARGVRAMREREDPEQDVESGPRLARAERARGRSAAEPPTHLQGDPANGRVEPANVRIEGVQVHNGDVHHVDARQTHTNQVAIINHYQPVFVQPWPPPAAAQRKPAARVPAPSQLSPLSRPLESAHDQSPWSPVDYSRHHNPWGSTFGRRIP